MKRLTIVIIILLLLLISGIICYKCCGVKEPENCSNLIFVAVNRIPDDQYNAWQVQNQQYMYNVPTTGKEKGEVKTSDGIVAIDASKIERTEYAAWLKANGDYIFFEETYPYIECAHNVNEASISNSSAYTPITLLQLKSQITAQGGNFYTDNYNKYTSFTINSSGAMTITMRNDFDATKNCFSLPLFRSIVDRLSLTNSSIIEFKTATVNKKKTIVFRAPISGGLYNYYDFSQIPP